MGETAVRDNYLIQFLREQIADEELLNRVLIALEPYFLIADSEEPYPLKPACELDKAEIAEAIQQALTLDEAPEVIPVSASQPSDRPDWMTEIVYQGSIRISIVGSLWDSLGDSIWSSFRDSLWDNFKESIKDSLKNSLWSIMEDSIKNSLWDNLRDSLWSSLNDNLRDSLWINLMDSFKDSLRASLGVRIWDSLKISTSFYLGFAITGNLEQVEKLEPLIRVQTGCVVLGTRTGDDNTWLVLAA